MHNLNDIAAGLYHSLDLDEEDSGDYNCDACMNCAHTLNEIVTTVFMHYKSE